MTRNDKTQCFIRVLVSFGLILGPARRRLWRLRSPSFHFVTRVHFCSFYSILYFNVFYSILIYFHIWPEKPRGGGGLDVCQSYFNYSEGKVRWVAGPDGAARPGPDPDPPSAGRPAKRKKTARLGRPRGNLCIKGIP